MDLTGEAKLVFGCHAPVSISTNVWAINLKVKNISLSNMYLIKKKYTEYSQLLCGISSLSNKV